MPLAIHENRLTLPLQRPLWDRALRVTSWTLAVLLINGCHASNPTTAPDVGPYALLLGTAQDAGLPQIGCQEACCEAARADPRKRRLASGLLIVDPASGGRWLLDAGPDLKEQVDLMRGHPATRDHRVNQAGNAADPTALSTHSSDRPPLVDAIFLTHAHMGHIAGLLHLGREAYAARALPVYGTRSMVKFLRSHQPWALMVSADHVAPRTLEPGVPVALRGPDGQPAANLHITAFTVPHRDEVTDTVGFLIQGPRATLAYLPDIDKWSRWERPIEELLSEVDIALLDGTFFADDELPGRDMASIPHPFMIESISRFSKQPADVRSRVHFTHLNHGNPAADPHSEAAKAVTEAGMKVAQDKDIFAL